MKTPALQLVFLPRAEGDGGHGLLLLFSKGEVGMVGNDCLLSCHSLSEDLPPGVGMAVLQEGALFDKFQPVVSKDGVEGN